MDLGIISAGLTPVSISGPVLGSQPSPQQVLALSLVVFEASWDPCSGAIGELSTGHGWEEKIPPGAFCQPSNPPKRC